MEANTIASASTISVTPALIVIGGMRNAFTGPEAANSTACPTGQLLMAVWMREVSGAFSFRLPAVCCAVRTVHTVGNTGSLTVRESPVTCACNETGRAKKITSKKNAFAGVIVDFSMVITSYVVQGTEPTSGLAPLDCFASPPSGRQELYFRHAGPRSSRESAA